MICCSAIHSAYVGITVTLSYCVGVQIRVIRSVGSFNRSSSQEDDHVMNVQSNVCEVNVDERKIGRSGKKKSPAKRNVKGCVLYKKLSRQVSLFNIQVINRITPRLVVCAQGLLLPLNSLA